MLLFFSKGRILWKYFLLNLLALLEQCDILNTSLLHIRVPMLWTKMTDHLNFRSKVFIFYSKFSKCIKHHSFWLIICRLEMFIDGLVNFHRRLSSLNQILRKLSNYISSNTFWSLSDVRNWQSLEQFNSSVLLKLFICTAKT